MITDVDIKKMKRVFATKDDLKNFVTKDDSKRFATKDQLSDTTKELVDLIYSVRTELKEDLVNFKDSILTEIIKLREDVAVVIGYRDLIEDHDKRIEKIETVVYQ